jgi:sulfhydrogenase subunit beta (sulfur reductase)
MFPHDVDSLPDLLDRSYDSLLWEATARRCYSCGSCNLSCPTCYCFNTYDELDMTLKSGERRREWDGCQLTNFALVAGGHNFRPKAASRLRHRIYRKAKWIKEREGIPGCVGCARCDRACTAKINSVEIYNQLAEEE